MAKHEDTMILAKWSLSVERLCKRAYILLISEEERTGLCQRALGSLLSLFLSSC